MVTEFMLIITVQEATEIVVYCTDDGSRQGLFCLVRDQKKNLKPFFLVEDFSTVCDRNSTD